MGIILTKEQSRALKVLAKTELAKHFYFSGGTALSHHYLQHRISEDLDFFNENEFDPTEVTTVIKSMQSDLEFKSFDYQNSFNRNLYFLSFNPNTILKLEFTYYPFKQINCPTLINGLKVDSPIDIATNKVFTIAQNPRGRDYYDLYALINKYNYNLAELRLLAKQKFDWDVDVLQLGTRLHEVDKHLDDPLLVNQIDRDMLIKYFQKLAIDLKTSILL